MPPIGLTAITSIEDCGMRTDNRRGRSGSEQSRILRLVTHGGDVGAERAGAKVGQAGARRLTGKRAYAGDERRLDLLAVGLANRPEAHDGRDGGSDLGQNEGLKTRFER